MNTENSKVGRKSQDSERNRSDIKQLGNEQLLDQTDNALSNLREALVKRVEAAPDAFGATNEKSSQQKAVDTLMAEMEDQYTRQISCDLRKKAGYVQVLGTWIHRSIISWLVLGTGAAVSLSFFIPMILSSKSGGFVWGSIGTIVTVIGGVVIFRRVKN